MLKRRKTKVFLCLSSLLTLSLLLVFPHNVNAENSSASSPIGYSLRTPDDCINLSSHSQCQCEVSSSQFNVFCPNLYMTVNTMRQATIKCRNVSIESFHKELLPNVAIGSLETVSIANCSLSQNETLKDIFNYLSIERVKNFIFKSNQISIRKDQLSGLQSVTDLTFKIKSSEPLPSDLFEGMPNVNRLELCTNQEQLPKGLLDPLTNLKKFFLESTGDSMELASNIFQNSQNLEYIDISNNGNLILSKDVFANATSLTTLVLCNNNITTLPPGVFDHLVNLTVLKLIGNPLNDLPNELFTKTSKLQNITIIVSAGELRTLPEEFLGNLISLRHVELSTGLDELPENLFRGSSNIKVINLSGNQLQNLPVNLFKDQRNLEELDLSDNLLTTVPDDIFSKLEDLKKLTLSHNQLTTISNSIFSSLKSLEFLSVDNNNLTFIANNAFYNTEDLLFLNLAHNLLDINSTNDHLDSSPFNRLKKLKELKLSHNSVTHIFSDWYFLFKDLQKLDLSHNNLTRISNEDLKFSAKGLHINLSKNRIREINFSSRNLEFQSHIIVDLGGNPIKCDCKILAFTNYLKNQTNLRVKTDNLQCKEPAEFNDLKLINIDPCAFRCPKNEPEICPESCQCEERSCDKTFIINCSNSQHFNLSALPSLDSLRAEKIQLDVQNNNLNNLPTNLANHYDKIFSLNLSGNNLESIEELQLPENLEVLDLRRNNLKTLPADLIDSWSRKSSKLKEIYLSRNPWPCTCTSKHLLHFTQNINSKVADRDALQCLDSSNQYQDIMKLTASQLCPFEKRLIIGIASAITVCGLIFAFLVALYYRYNDEIKVWLYSHNMCLWFVSVEDLDKDKKYDGFVSYSHRDKEFVQKKLLPFLEHGPLPFKICDHERDWLVGDTIPQQIIDSVEKSRRTIIILSDNYLDSDWGRMEFQAAHQLSLKERQAKLIIILYGELKNTDKLDAELKAYLKMNTYLEWGNPWFWKKLLYAMPHSKYSKSVREFSNFNEAAIKTNNELKISAK